MAGKARIMFVDDEVKILDGLRRMLRPLRDEWDMHFANGGQEALEAMAAAPFDVIVSDMRMPKMTGAELLEEVRRHHPHVVRMALSGHASPEMVLRCVGPTHQYLPKPCDAETLKAAVGRPVELRGLLASQRLRGVAASLESLPSPERLYRKVAEEVASPTASLQAVSQIVAQDVAMSGKVLQLVSTGFFGPPSDCCDPGEVVRMLGLEILRPLILSDQVFSPFRQARLSAEEIDALWRHSLAVGACARRIAQLERCDSRLAGLAFLGGLLHDVGQAILAERLPDEYAEVLRAAREGPADLPAIEQQRLGGTHAQVGAYLLGIWGLKQEIVRAVAYHHRPSDDAAAAGFDPLAAVHASVVIVGAILPELAGPGAAADLAYLERIGAEARWPDWREACLELLERFQPVPATA